MSAGGEFRRDSYQLKAGDFASTYGAGSQSYPGFSKLAASQDHRQNEAGYVGFGAEVIPHLQLELAGRFEHYSDVGNTETGKASVRYDFTPTFALRGTVSNGFRAPTLAQEYFSAVNVSPSTFSGQFPVNSAVAKILGAVPLTPEKSVNFSVGFTAEPVPKLHLAMDVYQIKIRNQIVDSGNFGGSLDSAAGQQIKQLLIDSGVTLDPTLSKVTGQYYTNGIDTETRGVDFTADYTYTFSEDTNLNLSLAVNFNDVELKRLATLPDGTAQFTPDVISEFTRDSPKNKVVLQGVYTQGPFDVVLRETRWGTSVETQPDAVTFVNVYYADTISPKYITDLEFGYKFPYGVKLSIGANNLFDVYPNQTNYLGRFVNSTVYSDSSPFGIDGGFYYARVNYAFGGAEPPTSAALPPPVSPPPAAVVPVRTYLVFFDWDRADLTARARQIVLAAAQASTQVQTTRLEVNGYTDLSGTAAYNQKLSVRRAQTVQSELVKDGVAPGEIFIHGYGESSPLVPTAPGVREPQNRRVEIVLK